MTPPARQLLACLATFGLVGPAVSGGPATGPAQASVVEAQQRWEASPHGQMLVRILPPSKTPAELPEPASRGARLLVRYCVQCHHLPNPAMHHSEKWPRVVERMVQRMRGQGNMGALMKDMMANVSAPNEEEIHVVMSYLRKHSQSPIDPARYPDLRTRGSAFRAACSQCHVLPDPASRPADAWPDVVARMERNMAWMNRVTASKTDPREPQLRVDEIVAYLQRHAPRH